MKTQFKIGDRVVLYAFGNAIRGEVVKIDNQGDLEITRDIKPEGDDWHYARFAILETIYDSPLYKALL